MEQRTEQRSSVEIGRSAAGDASACSVAGCSKSLKTSGAIYCNAHYIRWRKYGSPLGGSHPRNRPRQKLERDQQLISLALTLPGKSLAELGKVFGITPQAVAFVLKQHGVQERPPAIRTPNPPKGADHHWWKGDAVTLNGGRKRARDLIKALGICEDCGLRPARDRHHADEDPRNNDPENLKQLCRSCHNKRHGKRPPQADSETRSRWAKGRIPWNKGRKKDSAA